MSYPKVGIFKIKLSQFFWMALWKQPIHTIRLPLKSCKSLLTTEVHIYNYKVHALLHATFLLRLLSSSPTHLAHKSNQCSEIPLELPCHYCMSEVHQRSERQTDWLVSHSASETQTDFLISSDIETMHSAQTHKLQLLSTAGTEMLLLLLASEWAPYSIFW